MVFTIIRRLRDKIWPENLPPADTFGGHTVLITGASSGLGRAAAQHFARLGARLILACRNIAQGEAVRQYTLQNVRQAYGKIQIMELDMCRYSSCVDFVNRLKSSVSDNDGLDCAVLNAGIINSDFVESPEGWEETLQVNTLSTILLGLLLLSWMKRMRAGDRPLPHLIFVASRDHLDPDITMWAKYADRGGILRHFSLQNNWPSRQRDPNYAISKLMLMYGVRRIANQAVGADGTIDVNVNSVCPGLVSTNISRSIVKSSTFMEILVPVYLAVLGKSSDYGARFYVTAALASLEQHGGNIQSLFSEDEYGSLAYANMNSDTARIVQDFVWREIVDELKRGVPELEQWPGLRELLD